LGKFRLPSQDLVAFVFHPPYERLILIMISILPCALHLG
jgi:hypothetical protein